MWGFVALLICAAMSSDVAFDDSHVAVLTSKNFTSFIKQDIVLVEFYAPWCGHCKQLAPDYAGAAKTLQKDGILLGKVDATVETKLGSTYASGGYPTLLIFRQGRQTEYKGGRSRKEIVEHMREASLPTVKTLEDDDAATKYIEGRKPSVVLSTTEAKVIAQFMKVADKMSAAIQFGLTSEARASIKLGENQLMVLHSPDIEHKRYKDRVHTMDVTSKTTAYAIEEFVRENAFDILDIAWTGNKDFVFPKKGILLWIWYEMGTLEFQKNLVREFRPVVEEFHQATGGRALMADQRMFPEEAKKFGINSTEMLAFIEVLGKGDKYKLEGHVIPSSLRTFCEDYSSKKLARWVMSEPEPDGPEDGLVTVVGTTFNEVFLDKSKTVLLEFYAPWCGHCKKLAPIYQELAKHYEDDPTVVIAKMDATANDVPKLYTPKQGFPTIILRPAGGIRTYTFNGDRTLEKLIEFVDKYSGGAHNTRRRTEEL